LFADDTDDDAGSDIIDENQSDGKYMS